MSANPVPREVSPPTHVVHGSTQDVPKDQWVPFDWVEPRLGKQVFGEIAVVRPHGTSGTLMAGFWRSGPKSPGVRPDGSMTVVYSAPLGDEFAVVLNGCANLTVNATGKKHRIAPGTIVYSPKNVEVTWEVEAPFFQKYWCIFDGSHPRKDAPKEIQIASINDNPPDWQGYTFNEPKEGEITAGELVFVRQSGSTSTTMAGLWRSGKGIPGTYVNDAGQMITPYTGTLGDETILLLEGEVDVVETLSGKEHHFRAGDVIGLSSGMHITWTSKGPFSKKFWVITKDQPQA